MNYTVAGGFIICIHFFFFIDSFRSCNWIPVNSKTSNSKSSWNEDRLQLYPVFNPHLFDTICNTTGFTPQKLAIEMEATMGT